MSRLAAFFETRRLAALRGATTEFSKGEGMVYDKDTNSLYLAISVVRYGMVSGRTRTTSWSNILYVAVAWITDTPHGRRTLSHSFAFPACRRTSQSAARRASRTTTLAAPTTCACSTTSAAACECGAA